MFYFSCLLSPCIYKSQIKLPVYLNIAFLNAVCWCHDATCWWTCEFLSNIVFFFHLFCHFETDKNDFKLLWLSSHPLCGLAGNVALIIQCRLAKVSLFGINKQRAWKNLSARQDVITNYILRQIERDAVCRLNKKTHNASPSVPFVFSGFLFSDFFADWWRKSLKI